MSSKADRSRLALRGAVVFLLVFAADVPAFAQVGATGVRIEVGAGGGVFGGGNLGSDVANLRSNDAQASPFRLFSTDTRFGGAPLFEANAAYRLTRSIDVEARFTFNRPDLETSVSADSEGAPAITAREPLDQYLIEVGATVALEGLQMGSTLPFVSGGAGYVRQLHEGLTLIDQGYDYYIGGGIKHPLMSRTRARLKTIGVRAEARLRILAGDVTFDDAVPRLGVSGSVFLGF